MLSAQPKQSPDSINGVAVAIARTAVGTHAGIIFDSYDKKQLLHLAFHYDLRVEDAPAAYAWLEVDLPPQLATIVSSVCRGVASNYQSYGLPFAIEYLAAFDDSGVLTDGNIGRGFTCATMVLGIFQGAGILLVDRNRWRRRYDDIGWQWTIIKALAPRASRSFLIAQILAIGCYRFRPEDVVAAAIKINEAPSGLDSLLDLSNMIREEVLSRPLL